MLGLLWPRLLSPNFNKKLPILNTIILYFTCTCTIINERKSEQAHIPHAPTLLGNAVYNEWQFQALVTGNFKDWQV